MQIKQMIEKAVYAVLADSQAWILDTEDNKVAYYFAGVYDLARVCEEICGEKD